MRLCGTNCECLISRSSEYSLMSYGSIYVYCCVFIRASAGDSAKIVNIYFYLTDTTSRRTYLSKYLLENNQQPEYVAVDQREPRPICHIACYWLLPKMAVVLVMLTWLCTNRTLFRIRVEKTPFASMRHVAYALNGPCNHNSFL